MLYTEFKLKDAIAVAKEEGEARGMARGMARGIKEGEARGIKEGMAKARNELFSLLEKGVPLAEVKRKLGIHKNYAAG
jgi:predicted transposase YdaD